MTKKIEYIKVGDYYFPNLKSNTQGDINLLGRYARMRLAYLKQHERAHYNALLMNNELYNHLLNIEKQAYELHDRLLEQYKIKWGITEKLKERNQMEWIRQMNDIQYIVDEIVINEVLYN
ncbi:TnpV protein [Holdemanella porci]|uniref:TnpV protein n=1 Tax=Holdemanella porci TaxID=2652276 RepID=UPI002FDEDDF1